MLKVAILIVECCRLNPKKSHLGINKDCFFVAKMHVPHRRDRRLEMQRPVTTKKGNFKASRLEFFRARKHMIRKQYETM